MNQFPASRDLDALVDASPEAVQRNMERVVDAYFGVRPKVVLFGGWNCIQMKPTTMQMANTIQTSVRRRSSVRDRM